MLSDDEGLSELSESSDDRGLRNQGRTAATDSHEVKFLCRTISPCQGRGKKRHAHHFRNFREVLFYDLHHLCRNLNRKT